MRITAAELASLQAPSSPPSTRLLELAPGELLAIFVRGKLMNPLNQSAWIWQKRKRYVDGWKDRVAKGLWLYGRLRFARLPAGPKRISFLALTANTMDDDGLAAALKPVRDELVVCGVIAGDAPKDGNVFTYAQRIDRKARGVEIRVAPLGPSLGAPARPPR